MIHIIVVGRPEDYREPRGPLQCLGRVAIFVTLRKLE